MYLTLAVSVALFGIETNQKSLEALAPETTVTPPAVATMEESRT
jgi:hypothetical protein